MAGRAQPFKQGDLTKTLKAAKAAGIVVSSFEVDPLTGRILVRTGQDQPKPENAYDAWKASRNACST